MISISDEAAVRDYLRSKEHFPSGDIFTIEYLSGGVSCEVVKVKSQTREFVIKQALPQLRVKEEWLSDIRRIIVEKECLSVYNDLIPNDVPKLLFEDMDNYLFGMEAAPADAEMWKKQLLKGSIDFAVGRNVASALATVHNASAANQAIIKKFEDRDIYTQLRIDPYFAFTATRHPDLQKEIAEEIERVFSTRQVLVHGDYSPKNILVSRDRLFILDFEVAHYGDPAFDLGFLTNHLMLKAVKNKAWAPSYLNLMEEMVKEYLGKVAFTDRHTLEKNTVRTLAMLFLARVDGKSPAEYITEEADKSLIRNISYEIIKDGISTYSDVRALFFRKNNNL